MSERTSNVIENREIASVLERVAELLELQFASSVRVRDYRLAASVVRGFEKPIAELALQAGGSALMPSVAPSAARAIVELVATGRLRLLERLEGELGPERLFATIPGIGPGLAHRIHARLQIQTLDELELAAHDGRLERVRGIGPRRALAIRELLASLLHRSSPGPLAHAPAPRMIPPSAAELLAIDSEYRMRAARDDLPLIAPRRFNRKHEAWLPLMHKDLGDRHYTVLFSNTALAHRVGTTRDWVVIFYEDARGEGQATVVTERTGELQGKRVVRGREPECSAFYAGSPQLSSNEA